MSTKIDPLERLKTIRADAWGTVANGAWGMGGWLHQAERIYMLAAEVVGPEPSDKYFETRKREFP